jgi:hypothetical protein
MRSGRRLVRSDLFTLELIWTQPVSLLGFHTRTLQSKPSIIVDLPKSRICFEGVKVVGDEAGVSRSKCIRKLIPMNNEDSITHELAKRHKMLFVYIYLMISKYFTVL